MCLRVLSEKTAGKTQTAKFLTAGRRLYSKSSNGKKVTEYALEFALIFRKKTIKIC